MSSRSHSQTATRTSSQAQTRLLDFEFKRPTSSTQSEVKSNSEETESLRQIFHSEFKDLEAEINQLKFQCNQDSKIASKSSKGKQSSGDLQLDNDWLETKNIEVQKDNLKLETENELLRKKIEAIRQEKSKAVEAEAQEKMATLQEKLEKHTKFESQIENLVNGNRERTEEIVALQRNFDEMQTEFECMQHEKQQNMMQKRENKQRILKQSSALREKISENEEKIASLNRIILNTEAEKEEIIAQLEEKSIKTEAKAEQNIEDLTEKISVIKAQLEDNSQKEKILDFWKKARKMSIRKEELERDSKNLKSNISKQMALSKKQEYELKQLAKYEHVPQQDYIQNLQKNVSDLKEQNEQQKTALANQIQKLKSREAQCHQRQKLDVSKLSEECETLRVEVSALERESFQLQQQQNMQNHQQQRDLAELSGKCDRIKQQAARELSRYQDLLETEKRQIGNRQVDMHFLQRVENEALYNLGVLERETQFLLRDKQQARLGSNMPDVNLIGGRMPIAF